MIQKYKLVLWLEPKHMDINKMTNLTFDILQTLRNYGEELMPNYLPAMDKNSIKRFELKKENLTYLIEENMNKEGEIVFYDLGSIISFFTSLIEEDSSNISIKIGVSNTKFNNTLVIDLSTKFSGIISRREDFEKLFKDLVVLFKPFWGCVANARNVESFDYKYWGVEKPITVHWMNYFEEPILDKIGKDKILHLNGIEKMNHGYFYKMFDEPLDTSNNEHILYQKKLNSFLNLN